MQIKEYHKVALKKDKNRILNATQTNISKNGEKIFTIYSEDFKTVCILERFLIINHNNMKVTQENIQELKYNEVFVFGSNLAGIHGGGAAYLAKHKFGAIQGVGEGLTGLCYALPTKDKNIETRELSDIVNSINTLLRVVKENKDRFFIITAVGCGLAGHTADDIAPMFEDFKDLSNISLPQSFINIINNI